MFVLALLLAVVGGGTAYWLYSRSDEVLRLTVLHQLRIMAPTLKINIARANCDLMGRVRVYGLTCALPDDDADQPSLEIPEMIATLTDFENFDNFLIQKLYLRHPKMKVARAPDGTWNWQQATFQLVPGTPLPEVEIDDGSVESQFVLLNTRSRRLRFEHFNVSAHPANSKSFLIQVAALLSPTGPLTLEIDAATDGSSWKCISRNPWRVPVDQGLFQLLGDLSPEIADQLRLVGQKMSEAKAAQTEIVATGQTGVPVAESALLLGSGSGLPDFGVNCDCQLTFELQKDRTDSPVSVKARADILKGKVHNQLLALPLDEVTGTVYIDRRNIIVKDLRGSSGLMQVGFDAKIIPSTPISASLKLRNVELNDEIKSRLPESLRRITQSLGLTGICDLDASVVHDGGQWSPTVDLRLSKGTVTHERFPVTVREVAGQLRYDRNIVKFQGAGKYAGQVVESYGVITNPGPAHQADMTIKARNLPLDDESLAACPAEVRAAIESLRLKCRHDLLLRMTRAAGLQQKFELELNERIFDGTMSFTGFQYAVQKLKGFIRWKGDRVEFRDLSGVHDGTTLVGRGTYLRQPGPGRLDLLVDATNASFDRSLEIALPASLQQVWRNFQPKGYFDVRTKVGWTRGSPCEIVLPSIKVREGEIVMTFFPWSLQQLKGEFSYNTEPGKLVMKEMLAHHDDTVVSGTGVGWFPNQQPWRLEFSQLNIDNLTPNATFRNALPQSLQQVFDYLKPTGVFSFNGPAEFEELRLGGASVGAAWKLRTVLSGCSINVGTRVEEIRGAVQLNGSWDGSHATLDGELDLDSILIFRQPASGRGYEVTSIRGPISLRDNRLVAGNEAAVPPRKSNSPDSERRIRGQAIDGIVYLDAIVNLGESPQYRAFAELKNGRLESYAHQYLRGRNRLSGVMNGWINLRGKGTDVDRMTGEGKLIIDQAELYDSPLFAQMFQILKLQSPDKTAFENAAVNFTVENSRFNLHSIELLGDTLSMRGRGYVRFDGGMQMNFGVRLRQWQLLTNNLNAVEISGTVADPKSRSVPLPELDGALRQFFKAFDPRQMPRPGLFDPVTGQNGDVLNR